MHSVLRCCQQSSLRHGNVHPPGFRATREGSAGRPPQGPAARAGRGRARTARLLGRVLGGVVLLPPPQELLLAAAGRDVLNAHMDALVDYPPVHLLVDLHAHRALGHIPDHTRAPVVHLVRHPLRGGARDA